MSMQLCNLCALLGNNSASVWKTHNSFLSVTLRDIFKLLNEKEVSNSVKYVPFDIANKHFFINLNVIIEKDKLCRSWMDTL